ncbi:MAG: alpha/beta hydrolase, partial [Alphaproteobacteria bacterium]|nr:alpha/beta hydrolase [Alphaproteobacteria bacterium]
MSRTTIYFATNRMPDVDPRDPARIVGFGSGLGPIDGTAVRFGSVDVEVSRSGKTRMLPETLFVAPEQLYGQTPVWGSRTIFEQLRKDMLGHGRQTLAIIHGFSNSFGDAMERAAAIGRFYGVDANLFSFTWPSRGSKVGLPLPYADYLHDRGNARASGTAIARTMRILYDYIDRLAVSQVCRQPIHLIVHSMGNYALRHAVQALMQLPATDRTPAPVPVESTTDTAPLLEGLPALFSMPVEDRDPNRLRRTFDQIILAAADEDDDSFEDELELSELPRLANRVTVYHTNRDWILSTLSRYTKFNGPR